jgi:hypothetical protein
MVIFGPRMTLFVALNLSSERGLEAGVGDDAAA